MYYGMPENNSGFWKIDSNETDSFSLACQTSHLAVLY